jgi:hypothetical protein
MLLGLTPVIGTDLPVVKPLTSMPGIVGGADQDCAASPNRRNVVEQIHPTDTPKVKCVVKQRADRCSCGLTLKMFWFCRRLI